MYRRSYKDLGSNSADGGGGGGFIRRQGASRRKGDTGIGRERSYYPSDESPSSGMTPSTTTPSWPALNIDTTDTSSPPGLLKTSFSSNSNGTNSSPERNQSPSPSPKQLRSNPALRSMSRSKSKNQTNNSSSRPKSRGHNGVQDASPLPSLDEDRGILRGANIIRSQLMGLHAEPDNEKEKMGKGRESPKRSRRDDGVMNGAAILRQHLLEQSNVATSRLSSIEHQQWPSETSLSHARQASPRKARKSRSSSTPRHRPPHHQCNSPRDYNQTSSPSAAAARGKSTIKKPSQASKQEMDVMLDLQDLEDQMQSLRAHLHGHDNGQFSYLYGESKESSSPVNRNRQKMQKRSEESRDKGRHPSELTKADPKLGTVVKTEGLLKVCHHDSVVEPLVEATPEQVAVALAAEEPRVPEDPPAIDSHVPFPAVESKSMSCEYDEDDIKQGDGLEPNKNRVSSYLPGGLLVNGQPDTPGNYFGAGPLPRTPRSLGIEQSRRSNMEALSYTRPASSSPVFAATAPATAAVAAAAAATAVSDNNKKSKLDNDPGYHHALAAGTVWQTLVGEQIRFPKTWFGGARTPHLLGDDIHKENSWSYVASASVRSDRFLNRLCIKNRTKPGKLLLHVVVRDEINFVVTRHIVIGAYHPNARGIRQGDRPIPADESARTVWMAFRRCSNLQGEDGESYLAEPTQIQDRIDTVLLQGASFEEKAKPSPLGGKHTIDNTNIRAVYGDDAPMETVFVLEQELYQIFSDAADEQAVQNMKSKFSAAITLLEQFVYSRRR